jgi:hypothetical protein
MWGVLNTMKPFLLLIWVWRMLRAIGLKSWSVLGVHRLVRIGRVWHILMRGVWVVGRLVLRRRSWRKVPVGRPWTHGAWRGHGSSGPLGMHAIAVVVMMSVCVILIHWHRSRSILRGLNRQRRPILRFGKSKVMIASMLWGAGNRLIKNTVQL